MAHEDPRRDAFDRPVVGAERELVRERTERTCRHRELRVIARARVVHPGVGSRSPHGPGTRRTLACRSRHVGHAARHISASCTQSWSRACSCSVVSDGGRHSRRRRTTSMASRMTANDAGCIGIVPLCIDANIGGAPGPSTKPRNPIGERGPIAGGGASRCDKSYGDHGSVASACSSAYWLARP